jgi:hypothetical protein
MTSLVAPLAGLGCALALALVALGFAPSLDPLPRALAADPAGGTLWTAGAEASSPHTEWASASMQGFCTNTLYPGAPIGHRVTRVTNNVIDGTHAYRMLTKEGDNCFQERTEFGQGLPPRSDMSDRLFREGEDRWISLGVRPGPGFQVSPPTGQHWLVMQIKQATADDGTPPISVGPRNGNWELRLRNDGTTDETTEKFNLGPIETGAWARFLFHVKFSQNASGGFIEVHGDLADGKGMRQLRAVTPGSSMRTSTSGMRMGTYRDSAISGDAVTFYDGVAVTTTRAAAEGHLR